MSRLLVGGPNPFLDAGPSVCDRCNSVCYITPHARAALMEYKNAVLWCHDCYELDLARRVRDYHVREKETA